MIFETWRRRELSVCWIAFREAVYLLALVVEKSRGEVMNKHLRTFEMTDGHRAKASHAALGQSGVARGHLTAPLLALEIAKSSILRLM